MPDRVATRTRLHLWLTLLVALAVAAGVGATLIAGRVRPGGSDAGPTTALDATVRFSTLHAAGLMCPADATFSPDGSRILVLGLAANGSTSSDTCPAGTDDTIADAVAGIFDSATGQLVRRMALDPLVRGRLVGSQFAAAHVVYSGLGWTPDGTRIALVYTAFAAGPAQPENVLDSGLLLVNTTTSGAVTLRGDSGFFATTSGVSSGFPVWHLNQPAELPSFLPQPGLAYAWSLDGTPYPIIPLHTTLDHLPIDAGPRYPVGDPDGGSRYTIWQPGLVITSQDSGTDAQRTMFVSAFPAWSPDGASVTLMVAGVTLQDAPADTQMPRRTGMNRERAVAAIAPPVPIPPALPPAPPRDAALAAVQQAAGDLSWALVSWNPSGSLLGSINCDATTNPTMDVRETTTGHVIASVPLNLASVDPGCHNGADATVAGGYPNLGLSLSWSPVGDRLLLADRSGATLTLYHVRQQAGA